MLTMTRPLPATPYTGPVRAPRPLPRAPQPPTALPPLPTSPPSGTLKPILKRRPHTRRLQSGPSPDLPPVTEEEESEEFYDEQTSLPKLKKRPRPTPLIPTRTYAPSSLPLIVEIPENAGTFDRAMRTDEYEAFTLSPSMLLERRHSETTLEFPLPPSHAVPIPKTLSSPVGPADNSPTPSNISLTSISSASSSPYPITPHSSEIDERDMQPDLEKFEVDTVKWDEVRSPRRPYRSSSVVSLRSFNMAEFDEQAEDIYTLLHPRREVDARSAITAREVSAAPVTVPRTGPSPRLVLSVLDTAHGGSFEVPLMLGSFLSPPSSPATSEPLLADSDSEGEGIPISWSDSEGDDFGSALSSSEDDVSDNEEHPSRCLDPAFRKKSPRRRVSRDASRSPILPALPMLEPLEMGPDTPSVYSVDSFIDWTTERVPPRESRVPFDVQRDSLAPPASSPRPPSPFSHSRADSPSPVLRSRFSTSTLGSLPPQPTSSTQAFFARLTSRVKPPSPTKTERSPTSRSSPRRRQVVPASPAPSAFSFSTHSTSSRSSLDSGDSSSLFSEDSSSSSGLRRPPIPIELFLRG